MGSNFRVESKLFIFKKYVNSKFKTRNCKNLILLLNSDESLELKNETMLNLLLKYSKRGDNNHILDPRNN